MRQAISELRQLHDGEPEPAPAAAAEEEEEEEEEEQEGAEDEAALLQELLQKRAELQRMQAAIQQLESLGSDATHVVVVVVREGGSERFRCLRQERW